MKIQFNFAEHSELPDGNYEVGFTIAGITKLDKTGIIQASQKSGGMEQIKNQVLTELVALLQLELYGKVIESGGTK